MPWLKISDDWLENPKIQRLGKNGRALWIAVGNRCAKYSSDGLIEGDLLKSIAALAEVPAVATTKKLVELKAWHDHDAVKKCDACMRDITTINDHRRADGQDLLVVGKGDFYFHNWADHQLSKHRTVSIEARMAEDRSRMLRKDSALCREIQARDKGLCRYCGIRVNWSDRRGVHRATYDHKDPHCFAPNNGNFLEAINTSCGPCNVEKGQRTVEEWVAEGGRTEKPAGWKMGDPDPTAAPAELPLEDLARPDSGSSPDQIQPPGFPDPGPSSPHGHGRPDAPLGPGRIGPGPGPGPGRIGFGLVGAGTGLAGLVGAGAGRAGSAEGASPPQPATTSNDGSTEPAPDATSSLPEGPTP